MVRFVAPTEHRDILFSLDMNDGKSMHYISEVRVENLFQHQRSHKCAYRKALETLFEK